MAKKKAQNAKASASNGANVGYEAQLWQMADALRGFRHSSPGLRPVSRHQGFSPVSHRK